MEFSKRLDYVVIQNFIAKIPFGIMTHEYAYKVGDKLNLRPEGKMAKKWLDNGFIKALEEVENSDKKA